MNFFLWLVIVHVVILHVIFLNLVFLNLVLLSLVLLNLVLLNLASFWISSSVPGLSGSGTSTPGSSASGHLNLVLLHLFLRNLVLFHLVLLNLVILVIYNIDIEEALNEFSQCHHHELQTFFYNNFHSNLFIFQLCNSYSVGVLYYNFSSQQNNILICLQNFYKRSKNKMNRQTWYLYNGKM